jgi:hypothetical protein
MVQTGVKRWFDVRTSYLFRCTLPQDKKLLVQENYEGLDTPSGASSAKLS